MLLESLKNTVNNLYRNYFFIYVYSYNFNLIKLLKTIDLKLLENFVTVCNNALLQHAIIRFSNIILKFDVTAAA